MNPSPASSQSGLANHSEQPPAPVTAVPAGLPPVPPAPLVKPFRFPASAYEYKITALRECPSPEAMLRCETPEVASAYWQAHVASHPHFDPERECLAVLLLNTRHKIKGHQLVSIGTQDCLLVSSLSVFRLAVTASAHALVLMHNHPSGESQPSEADIKVTRDLIRAGQILKIEVLDHVVVGRGNFTSLRTLGYIHD